MNNCFPPNTAAARARLRTFAPHAGVQYARNRNYDPGPENAGFVSRLSPYLRMKVIDEADVSRAILARMDAREADKFLMEVWWCPYWKGWMEQRPAVWDSYRSDLERLHNEVQTQSGLRQRWEEACLGQTGIEAFDHWAQELVQTGYLHNHARMWFASIWIFTLDLPWQLGADFFLRHLLDGDAAVNTLSWRWVAGIQTQGKTYLADPENIAKFTNGRFADTPGLACAATPPESGAIVDRKNIPEIAPITAPPTGRVGLLLHSDDIDTGAMDQLGLTPHATAYLDATTGQSPWHIAPMVTEFREQLLNDHRPDAKILDDAQAVTDWAKAEEIDHIITPHAPVGSMRPVLQEIAATLPLSEHRRPIDSAAWPLATAGFFKFRKHIPDLLDRFAG